MRRSAAAATTTNRTSMREKLSARTQVNKGCNNRGSLICVCSCMCVKLEQGRIVPKLDRRGESLQDKDLRNGVFEECDFSGATFDGADLRRTTFNKCSLYWARFFLADLTQAIFISCDLAGTNFREANLSEANFIACDLGRDSLGGQLTCQRRKQLELLSMIATLRE
jgi:uncharacterized protein YjbI with pentapeptide repeats